MFVCPIGQWGFQTLICISAALLLPLPTFNVGEKKKKSETSKSLLPKSYLNICIDWLGWSAAVYETTRGSKVSPVIYLRKKKKNKKLKHPFKTIFKLYLIPGIWGDQYALHTFYESWTKLLWIHCIFNVEQTICWLGLCHMLVRVKSN